MSKNYSIFLFFVLFVNARAMLKVPEVPKIEESESLKEVKKEIKQKIKQKVIEEKEKFNFDHLLAQSLETNRLRRAQIKEEDKRLKKIAEKLTQSYAVLRNTGTDHFDFYKDLKREYSYLDYQEDNIQDYEKKLDYFKSLRLENSRLNEILSDIMEKICSLQDNLENNTLVLEQTAFVVSTEKIRNMARLTVFTFLVAMVGTACWI